jgi:alkylation response protein AidB-like acyl-CoA dehydrogenase
MSFALTGEQIAIRDMARDFARARIEPHALEWDEQKTFPVETLREAATLGMAGIYVREDVGGSGLGRLDAALVFEELSRGDVSVAAYISIHNMVSWMIDRFGDDAQRGLGRVGIRWKRDQAYCRWCLRNRAWRCARRWPG